MSVLAISFVAHVGALPLSWDLIVAGVGGGAVGRDDRLAGDSLRSLEMVLGTGSASRKPTAQDTQGDEMWRTQGLSRVRESEVSDGYRAPGLCWLW